MKSEIPDKNIPVENGGGSVYGERFVQCLILDADDKQNRKVDGRSTRDKSTYHFRNLAGQKFGKLTAIERIGVNANGNYLWRCVCDCGKEKIVPSGKLVQGRATNCGCDTFRLKSEAYSKHGLLKNGKKQRTFTIWNDMKTRCLNPNSMSYPRYGGRGIKICSEWLESYAAFHNWAIGNGYGDNLTIDRIDNDGNYCPENCRWVDSKTQANNNSRNHKITYNGKTMTLAEWATELKIRRATIVHREKLGIPLDKSVIEWKRENETK